MTFTTRSHGVIEGGGFVAKGPLMMVTQYRALKKVPNNYKFSNTTNDLTKFTSRYTKKVDKRSDYRIFYDQLMRRLRAGNVCRVGAHVFKYNPDEDNFEVYYKIFKPKM